jgi:hypothetical protein
MFEIHFENSPENTRTSYHSKEKWLIEITWDSGELINFRSVSFGLAGATATSPNPPSPKLDN